MLRLHNEYRAQHGAPPLTLDTKLQEMAQKHAEKMASDNVMAHSTNAGRASDYKAKGGKLEGGDWVGESIAMWPGMQSGISYCNTAVFSKAD